MTKEEATMNVLVAYATRHGATRGIAERVAQTLERSGLDVTVKPVDQTGPVERYDAFVVGGANYFFHWHKAATAFVRRHHSVLASHPVWLFASGPVGTDRLDAKGRDVTETTKPPEFAEFLAEIHPRDERVFFGAFDPTTKPTDLMESFSRRLPALKEALPAGDFRDWPEIEGWAEGIARELNAGAATAGVPLAGTTA